MHYPDRASLSIAAAQSISRWDDLGSNLTAHLRLVERAARAGAQLVLFPELSLAGYPSAQSPTPVRPDDERLAPMRSLARASGMTIAAGAPIGQDDALCIAMLIFTADGDILVQTKTRLHAGEERFFSPGRGGPLLAIGEARVAIAICAEAAFRDHAEASVRAGASVYAVSALQSPSGYHQAETRYASWARDLGIAVLLANHGAPSGSYDSAGGSAIWTPDGLLAAAPQHGPALVVARRRAGSWRAETVSV